MAIDERDLPDKKLIALRRLQIEMRRRVESQPALIETTAHAKRCRFGVSRQIL